MKDFNYYLNEGKVKKQSRDKEFAISLKNDAISRAAKVLKLDIKEFSKIIFENIYESLRELLDAVLALEGYKSYSHEASIAYIKKFGIDDATLLQLDDLRYKRNSSKYYGKEISEDDAREIIAFYNTHLRKIKDIIDNCAKK